VTRPERPRAAVTEPLPRHTRVQLGRPDHGDPNQGPDPAGPGARRPVTIDANGSDFHCVACSGKPSISGPPRRTQVRSGADLQRAEPRHHRPQPPHPDQRRPQHPQRRRRQPNAGSSLSAATTTPPWATPRQPTHGQPARPTTPSSSATATTTSPRPGGQLQHRRNRAGTHNRATTGAGNGNTAMVGPGKHQPRHRRDRHQQHRDGPATASTTGPSPAREQQPAMTGTGDYNRVTTGAGDNNTAGSFGAASTNSPPAAPATTTPPSSAPAHQPCNRRRR